eukprot:g5601.t1
MRGHVQGDVYFPSTPERLAAWLNSSGWGYRLDIVQTCLSLVAIVLYVVQVYTDEGCEPPSCTPLSEERAMLWVEVVMSFSFASDWLLHLFIARWRFRYVISMQSIVDLVTVVPPLALTLPQLIHGGQLSDSWQWLVDMVPVFRALRVLRLYRVLKLQLEANAGRADDTYRQELAVLCFAGVSIIFVATGVMHTLEANLQQEHTHEQFAFHDAFYFVMVTISTIGFGDFSPKSEAGRMAIVLLIFAIYTIIPQQVSKVMNLASQSRYDTKRFQPSRDAEGHVVLCGSVTLVSLRNFLEEFFHPARGLIQIEVVVMASPLPVEQFRAVVASLPLSQACKRIVTLLEGSALRERDLSRCAVATAEAVFVVADKRESSVDELTGGVGAQRADARAILHALGITSFCSARIGRTAREIRALRHDAERAFAAARTPEEQRAAALMMPRLPKLYLQLKHSEDKVLQHVVDSINVEQIVHTDSLRQALLAQEARC